LVKWLLNVLLLFYYCY